MKFLKFIILISLNSCGTKKSDSNEIPSFPILSLAGIWTAEYVVKNGQKTVFTEDTTTILRGRLFAVEIIDLAQNKTFCRGVSQKVSRNIKRVTTEAVENCGVSEFDIASLTDDKMILERGHLANKIIFDQMVFTRKDEKFFERAKNVLDEKLKKPEAPKVQPNPVVVLPGQEPTLKTDEKPPIVIESKSLDETPIILNPALERQLVIEDLARRFKYLDNRRKDSEPFGIADCTVIYEQAFGLAREIAIGKSQNIIDDQEKLKAVLKKLKRFEIVTGSGGETANPAPQEEKFYLRLRAARLLHAAGLGDPDFDQFKTDFGNGEKSIKEAKYSHLIRGGYAPTFPDFIFFKIFDRARVETSLKERLQEIKEAEHKFFTPRGGRKNNESPVQWRELGAVYTYDLAERRSEFETESLHGRKIPELKTLQYALSQLTLKNFSHDTEYQGKLNQYVFAELQIILKAEGITP